MAPTTLGSVLRNSPAVKARACEAQRRRLAGLAGLGFATEADVAWLRPTPRGVQNRVIEAKVSTFREA